jgi:hypothetical protein
MKLMIHFFQPRSRTDSTPYCFSNPTGEFLSIADALAQAYQDAGPQGNGATEFMITNEADETLEHRVLRGSSWEPADA